MSEYISKEELKDYLEKNISFGGIEKKFAFYDIIDSIPSADVRPNIHAHWMNLPYTSGCHCSACKFRNNFKAKFCPDCGADMREPKGEKEPE